MIPVLRLLSFFLTRLHTRNMIIGNNQEVNVSDELVKNTLKLLAVHDGFIAEVRARLWIYKGEMF
jgi:hypothetical protein